MSGFAKTKKAVGEMPDGAKKELLTNLIRKAEFMHDELHKLQKIISEKGWVEEYQNGENQKGLKKSSEGDTYNQLIKNYATIMQKILDNLPDGKAQQGDELDEFMKNMAARKGVQTR